MSSNQLKLSQQLCHPLYSASNALVRTYSPYLEELELTYPQYVIMMALWENDSVPIKQLIEMTYFDSGTLTPILQRLKVKSLILIKKDKNDQRIKIISLSKKGERLRKKAEEIPTKIICQLNLESAQINQLRDLTLILRHNLLKQLQLS